MPIVDSLNKIQLEKLNLIAQERTLIEKRKKEIAELAQCYGLLNLPDDEIKSAFIKIATSRY